MIEKNNNLSQLEIQNNRNFDVSIIVLVYNQSLSLRLILKSLLSQDFKGSYEIIVCDDGSNRKLFYEFRDSLDSAVVPIKYVWQQDRHFRAGAARNNGIRLSRGRYLIFLDGDMVPELGLVKKHINSHTKPKLLVGGNRKWRGKIEKNFKILGNKPISEALRYLEYNCLDKENQEREKKERQRREEWLKSSHPWRACLSSNVSVEWSPEVYFDENFIGWGPEDWEFNYRLCVKHGFTPLYKDGIITYHLESIISKPLITQNQEDIIKYFKNTLYFYDKCPDLSLEDVFFWFPRFKLNKKLNIWEVIPRQKVSSYNLIEIVSEVRTWLAKRGIYP